MRIICKNAAEETLELRHTFPFFIEKIEGIYDINYIVPGTKSAGQDGETLGKSTAEKRNIVITVQIKGDYEKNRNVLYNFFQSGETGTLYYYGNDSVRMTSYRVESIAHPGMGIVRVSVISLLCGDPHFYDIDETRISLSGWIGKIHFPMSITNPYTVTEKTNTLMKNIYNATNTEIGLRVRFRASGEVTSPKIVDVNRKKILQIGSAAVPFAMHAGETLEITTGKNAKQATLTLANGATKNVINAIAYPPQWVQLLRGDNLIKYDADSGIDAISCDIFYKNAYAGC